MQKVVSFDFRSLICNFVPQKRYKQQKTCTINVYRPYGETTLMLITCTKDDETTQTVYVAVLESEEPYESAE